MILFPEDGEQTDPGKSEGEGCMNVLIDPSSVDGKLGTKMKDGKRMKSFPKGGHFKFNKKGKLKEREHMEIRDWF
jgi:hypothetical protein